MTCVLASPPPSRLLTTAARVQAEAEITGNASFLTDLIEQASDLVESWAGRPLYRAQWVETRQGNEQTRLPLWRYPIVSLDTITYAGDAVTDVYTQYAEGGQLYRQLGFTSQFSPSEWSFTYTAGWIVPAVDLTSATITASSSDNSYNGAFPELLRAGDFVVMSGFSDDTNNGTKVIGTASTTKLEMTTALADETAAVDVRFHNLPGWIERTVIDLVKTSYAERAASSDLSSIKIGEASLTWSDSAQATLYRMSQRVAALSRLNV